MKAHLLILGTVALAACASAATVSYSETVSETATPVIDLFNLTKFDTSLGTLTGVRLVLDATATTRLSIFNFNSFPVTYSGSTGFAFGLTGPDGSLGQIVFLASFSGIAGAGPFVQTFSDPVHLADTLTFVVMAPNWGNYEGTGVLALTGNVPNVTSSGSSSGPSNTAFIGDGTTTVGGTASVIYDYAAAEVPEPATLVLLGSALLGLGAIRLRKS